MYVHTLFCLSLSLSIYIYMMIIIVTLILLIIMIVMMEPRPAGGRPLERLGPGRVPERRRGLANKKHFIKTRA